MPRVSILRREPTGPFPEPGQDVEMVRVTYVSEPSGPRSVTLPLTSYRLATPEELADAPRYQMVPVDQAAVDGERKAIQEDLERAPGGPVAAFDLP